MINHNFTSTLLLNEKINHINFNDNSKYFLFFVVNWNQLGDEVTTAAKLLYVGVFGFIMSGIVPFLDETDRFFSSNIIDISVLEWVYHVGISISGK